MAWDDIVVAHVTKHLAANYNAMVAYIKGHKTQHENGGIDEISVAGLSGQLADGQTPLAHKTSHQDGGSDEINVTGLAGELTDVQKPKAHVTSHQNGGSDELSVAGLNGTLADPQTPLPHAASHTTGGADILTLVMTQITGLVAALAGKEPIIVPKNTAFNKDYGTVATDVKMNGVQAVGNADLLARIDHVHPSDTAKMSSTPNVTSINDAGIADGEIAVFNLTAKDIRTSDKTIVTVIGADDTTVPTSKAVMDEIATITPAFETNTANIKMDGVVSVGVLSTTPRADHIHPSDTSKAAAVHTHAESDVTNLVSDLSAKAPLASPTFTGDPKAPTPAAGDNDTSLATTAFVQGEKIAPHPTLIATSSASKGGVFNGGFELGTGTATAVNTWIGSENYGWAIVLTAGTGQSLSYDNTISHSGKQSMKMVSGNSFTAISNCLIRTASGTVPESQRKYLIPVNPTSTYWLQGWIKTDAATGNAYLQIDGYDSAFLYSNLAGSANITGTNDWTYASLSFTGYSYIAIDLVSTNTGTIWVDDIQLLEVISDTANTSIVSTPLLSTITGVTSIDNIDVAKTGTYTDNWHTTNYWSAQQFQPTKNKITQVLIDMKKIGSPTGNFTIAIETDNANLPSGTVLASTTLDVSTLTTSYVTKTINLPCLWTSGKLWVTLKGQSAWDLNNDVAIKFVSGTFTDYMANGAGSFAGSASFQFNINTCYAKPTENATIICNGEKISLSTDEDGLLYGAIIDLDRGKYLWNYDYSSLSLGCISGVYAASAGGRHTVSSSLVINDWGYSTYKLESTSEATERYITYKVNTLCPIKHLKIVSSLYSGSAVDKTIRASSDGINWSIIRTRTGTDGTWKTEINETDLLNGLASFYVQIYKGAVVDYLDGNILSIEADLDTSGLPQPLIYPLAINQFTEQVNLPSVATRIYYRTAKFANANGVVVPHLEFTDGSGVFIKAIPCKLDNVGETNPAIDIIIADTTYGQQAGTGSADSTTGYILNDGEYMTFSTTTASPKVTYKVGGGTTSFANITKNRIYLSSNGVANSATKDPSHQMGVNLWYRVQSIVRTVSDLTQKISDLSNSVIRKLSWTSWTPILTWTTGTPASLTTVARYKIVDGVCFFFFNTVSTDSNACTNLTFTLPILPVDNSVYYSLNSIERYGAAGATYVNPLAYIDDNGASNVVAFRAFATATDAQAVEVTVSGWYEIKE